MESIRLDSYLIKAFFRSSLLVEIVFKIARKKLENEKELLFIQRNIDKFYDIFVLQFYQISLFNCERRCSFTFQEGNLSNTRAWYAFVIAFYSDFLERNCRFIRLVNCLKRLKGLFFRSLLCKQRRTSPPRFSRFFCNWQCLTS